MKILAFDIGGSSVKYAVIDEAGTILTKDKKPTPETRDGFFALVGEIAASFAGQYVFSGAAFSFPGAVDDVTGVIGGASAVPYIHDFPMRQELEARLELPIAMENDANCAALGESWLGAGKGHDDMAFLVIGSGVGGAVVKDKRIHHGRHLHGGEFGFMVVGADHHILSETGSTRAVAEAVADAKGVPHDEMDGEKAFALAVGGDMDAQDAVDAMQEALARAAYNIQYSIDPEVIVLGGAVSERPGFAEAIQQKIDQLLKDVEIAHVRPVVAAAQHGNDANLLGAVRNLLDKLEAKKK